MLSSLTLTLQLPLVPDTLNVNDGATYSVTASLLICLVCVDVSPFAVISNEIVTSPVVAVVD